MSTPSTNDNPKGTTESNIEFAPAPKKFVFDIPNNEISEKDNKKLPNSRNLWLLKCLPILHEFKRPENITEAYDQIIQAILNLYKGIRDLILADCLQSLKEVIKDQKIRDPSECLQFIKVVVTKTYQTAKELSQIDDISKTAQEYEKLLQKSEDKIRELIRNEQIYRISFDQFAAKDEEAEKNLLELQIRLNGNQDTIEKLNKETAQLKLLLQKKDEELQLLMSERQSHNVFNQSKFIVTPSETCRSEYHKPKAQSLASQNLKTFLKNNKPTPSDDSNKTTMFDLSKILSLSKNPNSKTPQASTARALQTSGNMFDFTHINLKSHNLNNSATKLKDTRDRIKKHSEVSTERRRLESSGDLTLNNSSRLSEWQSALKHSKRVSSQKAENSQSKAKSKSPSKSKTKREHSEGDEKPFTPGKFRPYEDLSLFLVRTEPSQEQNHFLPADTKNKAKEKESEYQLKASICRGYNPNTKKKANSSKSKFEASDFISNSREKASESKGSLNNNKQTGSSAAGHRSVSKGQSQATEQKEEVKNFKSNTPLINVMLKKLAEKNGLLKK